MSIKSTAEDNIEGYITGNNGRNWKITKAFIADSMTPGWKTFHSNLKQNPGVGILALLGGLVATEAAVSPAIVAAQDFSKPQAAAVAYTDNNVPVAPSTDEIMDDPRIKKILAEAKDASTGEKVATYGTGLWMNALFPGMGVNLAVHEGAHSLAAILLGAGVETYSVLPPVFSDRLIKRIELKETDWSNIEEAIREINMRDYSKDARMANYTFAALRAIGMGPMAYMETKTPMRKISPVDKTMILLAPYVVDMTILAAMNSRIGEAALNNDKLFFNFSPNGLIDNYAMGSLSVAAGGTLFGILGIGDFATLADAWVPSEKHNRWYHKLARKAIAGSVGGAITYAEFKMYDGAFNRALDEKYSRFR